MAALGLGAEVKGALEAIACDGRLDLAKKLASKAAALKAVTSKTLDATVVSAVALSKDQQATVTKALPTYAPAGQTVNVSFVVVRAGARCVCLPGSGWRGAWDASTHPAAPADR